MDARAHLRSLRQSVAGEALRVLSTAQLDVMVDTVKLDSPTLDLGSVIEFTV